MYGILYLFSTHNTLKSYAFFATITLLDIL